MVRLISATFGLLSDVVVGWLVPLVGIAILMPVLAVVTTANNILGSVVTAIILAILVSYHIRNRMWWQLAVVEGIFLPLIILAIFAPAWAILWTFFVQSVALGLLFAVPGAVLPAARRVITAWLIAGIIIALVLAGVVRTGGEVFFVILGLLALGWAAIIFSMATRPWEIRRVRRRAGRLLAALGVSLIFVGLIYNWRPTIGIHAPQALEDAWVVISAPLHRQAVAEEVKTKALKELSSELLYSHLQRWEKGIEKIPTLPLSGKEWNELGVPKDP